MDKRYDHLVNEKKCQDYWATQRTYSIQNASGPLYSIDTPPPTVSGSLHIGHVFSYTQTDIIARYKRMCGYAVFYPFGFDDNGLPTERYVEKKRNIKGHQIPRSEFISICLEESALAADNFKALWQKVGISADWSKTYSTISPSSRKIAQESFIELFAKGHIYRKNEPALYCTSCHTSVAQAELDDKEVPSFFSDIAFKDHYGSNLIIGTTRPELLSSCVALLYNPQDERYSYLQGQEATVPLFNNTVPIIADELVDIDKGTGLVMCCTFGDKKDIEWFKKHNLPYRPSINKLGKWEPHTGVMAGLNVHEARTRIIKELRDQDLLIKQREIVHTVNVHERCKKEIEFMLLPQWFVAVLPHKDMLCQKTDLINWYPHFMKSRLINWIENIGWDWCISRQRFYGISFPAWHCNDCNAILLARPNQLPVDPQETPYQGPCPHCNSTRISPDTDVMDTWNTSSLSPYICAELYNEISDMKVSPKEFIPMSMRPQAHDIIRTWAFDTLVKTTMHQDSIPWKDVVISGHVLSDAKEKLSKSKENSSLTPENLLSRYPADVIRYWTASNSLGQDSAFSENQLKIGLRLVTKLWNAFLFIREHLQTIDDTTTPPDLGVLNEWLLHHATETYRRYQGYFEEYEFGLALHQVEQFFWNTFCDNYIELVKHQLFNPDLYTAKEVAATRWTLHQVGLRILQWYAPYLPHITETIYQDIYKQSIKAESLHQTHFNSYQSAMENKTSAHLAQALVAMVAYVRKLKTEKQLSLKNPLASLHLYSPDALLIARISPYEQLIRGVTHAQQITFTVGIAPTIGLQAQDDDQWHASLNLEHEMNDIEATR